MSKLGVIIVGYGKIAADEHFPAIAANPDLELVGVVSERGVGPDGVPIFKTIDEVLASDLDFAICSHCNTPSTRFETAIKSIRAGKHTMLEKPPAATLTQLAILQNEAARRGVSLMTTWHSQANVAVDAARDWLRDKPIRKVHITWRENVRKWHPNQQWIWEPGGFGVFDPGINGLSVATKMLPFEPFVIQSTLSVPANRAMPIAAELMFGADGFDGEMTANFDWRETEGETWRIDVACADDQMSIENGGRLFKVNGQTIVENGNAEYPGLYADMVALVAAGKSYVHADPIRIVADAFLLSRQVIVDDFFDEVKEAA
jgi:predicted dehydrogenase